MYSNMCVKIALCLVLIVSIDGYVLKNRTLPLSAEGMTVNITVRSKKDPRHPLSTLKIDINEKDKKVEMSMAEAPSGVLEPLSKANNDVPTLEDRDGVMVVGSCAEGYMNVGGICIDPQLLYISKSMAEAPSGVLKHSSKTTNDVPTLESRSNIVLGLCPAGYTPAGERCVPDNYSDYVTE